MVNITGVKEIDLHNLRHLDAEIRVCESLEEAWASDERGILFIHGYHGGVSLRNYIRGRNGLQAWWYRHFPELPPLNIIPKDNGSTYVTFAV